MNKKSVKDNPTKAIPMTQRPQALRIVWSDVPDDVIPKTPAACILSVGLDEHGQAVWLEFRAPGANQMEAALAAYRFGALQPQVQVPVVMREAPAPGGG